MASDRPQRKLAAILAADVVGYSRLAGADEDRILARLRALRSDLIDPTIAVHNGRVIKRTGDGILIEFRSVVDAVNCAVEVQNGMAERNAGLPEDRRIMLRVGIHIGDVVEESDGDLMGDGVNVAARLEGIAKPGAICLSEDAYRQVKGRLKLAVTDLGATELKNIAEPVHVYSLEVGVPVPAKPLEPKRRSLLAPLGAAVMAPIVIGAAAWYLLDTNRSVPVVSNGAAPAEPAHLSIVVLPFANLSGGPDQDYFADGITENLTTDLSRIRSSFVIARNTAFTFKAKNIDAKEIGKELGVRYVLEGSVQRDQNRVRVNAQLIDAESGADLWADRFEEDVADLFKMQDQIVARLGNVLGFELVKAEAEKSARSKNPDAMDLAMRGWEKMFQSYSLTPKEKEASHKAALALFDQALKFDPNDADALAGQAFTYMAGYIFGWASTEADLDAKIVDQADRAVALAPDNMRAYYAKSTYLNVTQRPNEALRAADAGLAINPNYAPLLDARAFAETALGRFAQAKSDTQRAIALSPRDPETATRRLGLGMAELGLGQFDAAIVEYQKSIDAGAHSFIPYANLAAAYALEGKTEEAKSALEEARRLNPKLTIKWLIDHAPNVPVLFEGLRKAGLPEDAPAEAAHLSIVVLPFTNLSVDPSQDYFADGITENLTTDLSRIRDSFVIARNTAFTYKGKAIDAKAIGKELGVRYILEGSVQRDQNRVRVNAQLIDVETGAHIWADRFEADVADLFKLQDQVVAQLANALRYELGMAEAARGARAQNPDAIDLAMRGWALIPVSLPSKEQVASARPLFEQALKIDSDNSEALAGKASTTFFEYIYAPRTDIDYDAAILGLVDRAVALDRGNIHAYRTKGQYLAVSGRPEDAVRALDAGLAIDPNAAGLLAMRSNANDYLRYFEQAKSDIQQAMVLSPRDPSMSQWFNLRADAELGLSRFDDALEDVKKAIDGGHRVFYSYLNLAAAYSFKADMDKATAAMAEARRLNPDLSVKWLMKHKPVLQFAFDGLRKAGLPEE
jgi:adenylate cyclase